MQNQIHIKRTDMLGKATKTIRDLDSALWAELRIVCLREGVSISTKLNELIAREIERKGE